MLTSMLLACAVHGTAKPPHGGHHDAKEPHTDQEAHEPGHHPPDGATVHHRFDDVERWVKVFDDPERDAWQKPAELVAALDITPGSTVADIGAGTGYFNPHLAAAVGPEGRVIAVDIEPGLVEHMRLRAVQEGTPQVQVRLGQPSDPALEPGEVDLVLLVDTYHHISDRRAYFEQLRGAMQESGRLVVVDFAPGDIPVGPPPEHRLAPEQVKSELEQAGWTFKSQPELLPYQFVMVFNSLVKE